jgi:hypothetical protein
VTGELFRTWRPADEPNRAAFATLLLLTAVGAVLRAWGLGGIGLHGDEDVMALATRGILETGVPVIPSGMLYPRAVPQLYLMAGSVAVFGDTEWALRLPSAIMGILMVPIGYALARRFLTVPWALAVAATIALLPSMIVLSQTARMYVFFVAFVMLFGIAIFRWERTGAVRDWLLAVVVLIAALLFHSLSVFASLLFFFPGVLRRSARLLALGAAGFLIGAAAFQLISSWISAQYFPLVSPPPGAPGAPPPSLQHAVGVAEAAIAALLVVGVAAVAFLAGRRTSGRWWLVAGAALLAAAAACAVLVQYHLAGLAWFFGAILYVRSGRTVLVPAVLGAVLLALFGWHAWEGWSSPEVRTFNDLAEALLGKPKPLSYLTFAGFSPAGVALYALLFVGFAVAFARGRPLADHVVLFLLAVLGPLFLIAVLEERFIPPRYVVGMLPFFLLSAFAGLREVLAGLPRRLRPVPAPAHAVAALLLLASFVNPSELRANVNPHYADFARLTDHRGVDHKGAAEYVIAHGSDEEDLVIVMDSQQHGYYLPERMDYYMRSLHAGRNSSILRDGRMLCLYTGVPQIATGEELERVLRESDYDEVFVVGSGEIDRNRMRYMSDGIWDTMQALGFEQAWTGRDGATPIWRYARPEAATRAGAPGSGREAAPAARESD